MSTRYCISTSLLLASTLAWGADPLSCRTGPEWLVNEQRLLDRIEANADPDAIVLEAGGFEAQFGAKPTAAMTGGVILRRGDRASGADSAEYDPESRALLLSGNVRYEDPDTLIASDSAEFAYDLGRILFRGAEFSLASDNARGSAGQLEINSRGRLELDDVRYTTCPPGSNDWLLVAGDIDIDSREGVGTARSVKLRFQGVTILYAPYLSFPVGDARKSGILTPELGSTSRGGTEFRVPYYFNLAPNYDATLTPRLLTDRGLQAQGQFRYLTDSMSGRIDGEYLDNDSAFNDSRSFIGVQHRTLFDNGWRNRVNYRSVSDSRYFEDLGGSLSLASTTHLNRSLSFDRYTRNLSIFGQVQAYQTIDDAILPESEPYRRLPQLVVRGYWPDRLGGMALGMDAELVNFDREVGVTGWRFSASPSVELPIGTPAWFIRPGAAFDYTRYDLHDTAQGQRSDPSRGLPIGSLDAGAVLERTMANSRRVQTLEPRMLYVHVPYREQADLPVFDTITPDLSLVQLYRKNRFLGADRIADTDQVSVGVTSRIIDIQTGQELASATIGQIRYLSESGVLLPGEEFVANESSDYIAEMRFLLFDNVNFDVGHQWGTAGSGTTKSQARLQYRPASNKVLNIAYRFRRDALEQGDLSWSWPVASNWNFVGRYNYSFRDEELLEEFYGVEYESCCWGLRVVNRRHISTRNGTRDSSFGLQLVLKGMSSVGTATDKILERGILGYTPTL